MRVEAGPQKPVLVQALPPLGVAHVRLAVRHLLDLAGIDHHHHHEAALGEELGERNPVDPGRLQGHRGDPALLKPVGEAVQVAREGVEGAHRLGIAARRLPHASGRRCRRRPHAGGPGSRARRDGDVRVMAASLWDIIGGRGCAKTSHS
nr:hypothetical protein [Microvirga sp. KLBC 81]